MHINDYITFKRAEGRMDRTITDYERCLVAGWQTWCNEHGITAIADATRDHVRCYIADLRNIYSAGTVALYIRNLRAYLRWVHLEGFTESDLATAIGAPRGVIREEIPPSPAQVRAMLDVCNDGFGLRDRAIIMLLLSTGIRRGEFCQLQRDSIQLEGDSAWFQVYSGKAHQRRFCFLTTEATQALGEYLRSRDDNYTALFLSGKGTGLPLGYDGVYLMIKRRAKEAGLDLHPHIFRKFFATQWIKQGGDEYRLMKTGGWSDPALLEVYVRLAKRKDLQKAHQQYAPKLFVL